MSPSVAELSQELGEAFRLSSMDDPYPMLAERRRETPVMKGDIMVALGAPSYTGQHAGETHTVFRHDDVVAILRNHETFSSSIWEISQGPLIGRSILAMDGAEHRQWRGYLQSVFGGKLLSSWDESIFRPLAAKYVADLASKRGADLIAMALEYSLRAIYEILGLEDFKENYEEFHADVLTILLALWSTPDPAQADQFLLRFQKATEASARSWDRLLPIVQRKRAAGASRNDLISSLIRAEYEGGVLDDEQITSFLRSLLLAATDTTTRQFLNTLTLLLQRPDELDRIRRDRSRLRLALAEGERLEPPALFIPRMITRDVVIRGTELTAGTPLLLAIGSANRDPEAYPPDPDEFRIDRTGPHHATFGFGTHICSGMNTTRREIAALIDAMLDGLPGLRVDPDAPAPLISGIHFRGPSALPVVWD
ncbi:cytochrome P450 226B1 [Mycobacterium ulcerans subsp. shinshuense]|uniref:Cytochrome P450 226B1 n=3 Tax=Mycobacterium ulcerans TaxID=1809 RepID=A0A1B4Y9B6_MYCUL|nr:cytochrome P450 226B1 [Mycobacterium ulcerans subsp. shinshuense]